MDTETIESNKTIDVAIATCGDKIVQHRAEASRVFRMIMTTLLFFGVIIIFIFYANVYNQNKASNFLEELNVIANKIERDNSKMQAIEYNFRQISSFAYQNRVQAIDTFNAAQFKSDSITSSLRKLPLTLQSSLLKIDNTVTFIFYGIFILVFGILTSFYRFHLKEISKYEHFLFGFERIRIAGNNSVRGYDDDVRISLVKDAFTYEQKGILSKEKKVESPIPGHPTSDAFSFLMNKILDAVEITAKTKK